MPIVRKTGIRSPWLPSPLQGALERVQPALVVLAVVPSFALGGNAQFVGQLPRAEDTSNPPRAAIVVQQPAPMAGTSQPWMPRPLDAGVVPPPDRLSPTQIVSGPQPQPQPSFWLPMPLRVANTDPLRPTLILAEPPDPTLAQPSTLLVGRLPRDEDTSRPARPALVSIPPAPIPGAMVVQAYAPRDTPAPPPDKLSPVQLINGQQPQPNGAALTIGRITSTPSDRPVPTIIQIGTQPQPGAQTLLTYAPRDQVAVAPDRLSLTQVLSGQQPIPAAQARMLAAPRDGADRLPVGARIVSGQQPQSGAVATFIGQPKRAPLDRPALIQLSIGTQPQPTASVWWGRVPCVAGATPMVFASGTIRSPGPAGHMLSPEPGDGTIRSPKTTGTIRG